jgi:murein L,D-transpeptidase YafK
MRTNMLLVGSVAAVAIAVTGGGATRAAPPPNPCAGRDSSIVVRTSERALLICDGGAPEARFAVALGAGGIGKRRRGDGKTPLGAYALGTPRRSQDYGLFIPIGYPTAAQARAGFTGDAVGIHGPPRPFAHAGALTTLADWTAGCIAVGSDEEVERIASWVRRRPKTTVHIE